MVSQLSSGPCVAMEIISEYNEETPARFRVFTGPADPVSTVLFFTSKKV